MLAATQGVSFAWLRFFYVYGPGQRGASLVPALATSLLKGESPAVKTPHNAHDFIYVDDVASAIAVAAHRDVPSGVYNIGTGKSVPIWRVCQLLELAIGRESGCFQEQGAPTGSTSVDFWADTRKTESTLGWTARTSIEQGVAAYLDYLRGTQA
jgi:nucleoside-diphosphate-sugar epimerase